jgi:prepilin-type N-terminal cleavage/methylation domain-containing protein
MKRWMARPGFTVLEVMVAAGIFSLIFLGGYTMLSTASHSFDRNAAQSNADTDAVLGMQHIIADLREAKSFTIDDPGPEGRIVITFPIGIDIDGDGNPDSDGDGNPEAYDRYVPDTDPNNQVTYYLDDRVLYRLKPSENGGNPIPIRWGQSDEYGVEELRFESTSPLSVKITVKASVRRHIATRDPGTGNWDRIPKTTELTQRLVYLRNW